MKESDMYLPVKQFLESRGFQVKSEILSADIVAVKKEDLWIIELKLSFSVKLLYQLVQRMKLTPNVYACLLIGKGGKYSKSYKNMCLVLKNMGVGFISLDQRSGRDIVQIEFEPQNYKARINKKSLNKLLKEFHARTEDLNIGGVNNEKIFTVYRESAIRIAMYLEDNGTCKVKQVREALSLDKAQTILHKNYYGWYVKEGRGQYSLSDRYSSFQKEEQIRLKLLKKAYEQ